MDGKYITGICTVFVAVLMVGGLLMPIIDHITEGEPVINPDAGWIRMNYDTAASAYTISISASEDGISVANGTDVQKGDDETIYYADSNLAVWLQDGYFTVLGQSTNGPVFFQSEDDITITRDSEGVTVTDGVNTVAVGAPAWAYVPYSSGSYGFFADGVAASTNNNPIVAVGGGFAGVYAYNDITRYAGLGLELQTTMDGGKITGAYWAKPSAEVLIEPLDPGSIIPINPGLIDGGDVDIQPIDPITIDPEPDVSIMAVPTPTYTDGDWGYDLMTVSGVQYAKIVSYSGTGGGAITIPAVVGGYNVYEIGKGVGYTVFDTSLSATDLIISEGIVSIAARALNGCSGFTGTLTIPSTVTSIGESAFYNCNFTGTLTIPSTVTTINNYTFYNCKFTGTLTIPSTVTTIGNQAFTNCTGFIGSLVIPSSVTSIGSQAFFGCSGIETVVIPSSVATIKSGAFQGVRFTNLIVVSDATPADTSVFSQGVANVNVLDLSDAVTYAPGSYGLAATVTVSESIGDSIGYLGIAYIPGESDLSPSAVALMYVIPAIILVSLIIFGAVVFVRRDY